jgi:GLPGLI family protein
MKKILLSFSFCIYALLCVAQHQYKITYKGTLLSSSLNARLEQEVNDPVFLQGYKDLIEGFEVQYALYVDVSKGRSILLEQKEIGLDGPPPFKHLFSFYDQAGNLYFEDLFRGKQFKVRDSPAVLQWDVKQEIMKVGNFNCRKAVLKNDPFNTVVWFCEDYPISFGPYIGAKLPGLAVLLENDYYVIKIDKITKEAFSKNIENQMNAAQKKTGISYAKYREQVAPLLKKMKTENIID